MWNQTVTRKDEGKIGTGIGISVGWKKKEN